MSAVAGEATAIRQVPGEEGLPVLSELTFDAKCAGPVATRAQLPKLKSPTYRPGQISLPVLPEKSRQAGEDGLAVVNVLVNERGRVVKVQLNKSTGYPELDKLAMEHTSKWKLISGRVDDKPVCAWTMISVRFDSHAKTLQR